MSFPTGSRDTGRLRASAHFNVMICWRRPMTRRHAITVTLLILLLGVGCRSIPENSRIGQVQWTLDDSMAGRVVGTKGQIVGTGQVLYESDFPIWALALVKVVLDDGTELAAFGECAVAPHPLLTANGLEWLIHTWDEGAVIIRNRNDAFVRSPWAVTHCPKGAVIYVEHFPNPRIAVLEGKATVTHLPENGEPQACLLMAGQQISCGWQERQLTSVPDLPSHRAGSLRLGVADLQPQTREEALARSKATEEGEQWPDWPDSPEDDERETPTK